MLTIYVNGTDFVFVYRDGSRITCDLHLELQTVRPNYTHCKKLRNFYDYLGVCDNSTTINKETTAALTNTPDTTTITEMTELTSPPTTKSTPNDTVFSTGFIAIIAGLLLLIIFFVTCFVFILKKLLDQLKKKWKRPRSIETFVSETVSESDSSSGTFPLEGKGVQKTASTGSDSVASNQPLIDY